MNMTPIVVALILVAGFGPALVRYVDRMSDGPEAVASVPPRVPPCPALAFDASRHTWDLWRANFPGATQCVTDSPSAVVDVPGR